MVNKKKLRIFASLLKKRNNNLLTKNSKKMSNHYETVFIMTPVLSEEQAKETVSKYKKMLADNGCKIVAEDAWGLRKLQYPIQKKTTGFYHLIEFTAPTQFVAELEVAYKRDERLLRFLTVKLDKHAIAYSEKRRNKAKATA
jgi:small subunit ribosomal protein S6